MKCTDEEWQKWEPHGSEPDSKDPWQDFQEPQKEWRDFDRMQGHKRFEFTINIESVLRTFKDIFGRIKKWHMQH